jgi:hypothetical protein
VIGGLLCAAFMLVAAAAVVVWLCGQFYPRTATSQPEPVEPRSEATLYTDSLDDLEAVLYAKSRVPHDLRDDQWHNLTDLCLDVKHTRTPQRP